MVSLKAGWGAWMAGRGRESVQVYARYEADESESPVAEGDGPVRSTVLRLAAWQTPKPL
jgi:hypothetical protein